ncbi:MAG: hypothetical protein M3458_20870 [Acidobacteriota bacterium]|nr:hypothetical protein [Acidobacteriota bacterium]
MSLKETRERQDKVAISLEVPRRLRDKARVRSAQTGVPVTFVLRQALELWVADVPDKRKGKSK